MASEEINASLREIEEIMSMETEKPIASKDFNIPTTPSCLHNKFDIIYAALADDKQYIEDKLKLVEKAQRIVDLLSYRTYEVRYNFYSKLEKLETQLDEIKAKGPSTSVSASLISLRIVEIQDDIQKRADQFLEDDRYIKNILIKAQDYHEKCIDKLDKTLDNMKRRLETLQLLFEASQIEETKNEIDETLVVDMEECIEKFVRLQTQDWRKKRRGQEGSLFLDRKLSLTPKGLIATTSGRTLNYHEVKESNLLDDINIFHFDVDTTPPEEEDQKSPDSRSCQSNSATNTNDFKPCSDDLNYIKDTLGVPLTLALAEITALQPKDPIHYLGHWLFKYRYNQQIKVQDKIAMEQLKTMRAQLAETKWKEMMKMEVKGIIIEMITRAEEQAYRKELERIEKEQAAEEELIDKTLQEEAKDKFDTYDTGLAV